MKIGHHKIQQLTFCVFLIYLWAMMIMLGSIVLETWMIYPNIFADPPDSFAVALDFMSVRAPHDFFPPLGLTIWVTGTLSLLLGWHVEVCALVDFSRPAHDCGRRCCVDALVPAT